jgi:hypothetical protein
MKSWFFALIFLSANSVAQNNSSLVQMLSGLETDAITRCYEEHRNQINADIEIYNLAESERLMVRAEFDRLSSISIFDDPFGHIAAQMQLPSLSRKHNNLMDQRDTALRDINTRKKLIEACKFLGPNK